MLERHMDLPDVERLLSISASSMHGLGQRLGAIGLTMPFLARVARIGERLDDALRRPMRVWNARRMKEPAATALRLFMLHDAVSPHEVRAALGEIEPLRECGLVDESDEGMTSRFHLALAADVYCLGDRPGSHANAVLPLCSATLELVRAAMPRQPIDAALDVGCGAGGVGLLLARSAARVVATDVSARALAFARFNAALNGITNIELRAGHLFEPVRGELYDRIAAQPPFLALRDGAAPSTFLHGGARGDELPLRLAAGAALHLASRGRAVVLGDWPLLQNDALDARVRAAVGRESVDVLVLQAPSKNLDEYCALHAAIENPDLGASFSEVAIAQRDHFEKLGVRGLTLAFVVLEPSNGEGWTSLASVRHLSDAPITPEAIDRMMAAHRLAHARQEAIGAACLRLPEGASRTQQPVPNGGPPATVIHLPAGRPEWPIVIDADAAAIVERIAGAPTVLAAARTMPHAVGAAIEVLPPRVEAVTRDALLRGALDIA
jgi:SAM-dependent methyltransferase